MKKFTVLATLAVLAYAPASLAGTVVTNTGANGNIIQQSNTALGSGGITQGGSQVGIATQTATGVATGSGSAVVVNQGLNGNLINQSNTSIQAGYKGTGATFQGGSQTGVANQTLTGSAAGFGGDAIVANKGLNGNIITQYNTSIQDGKKLPSVFQGGQQTATANQTLTGTSTAISVGYNTAGVFNEGANANVVKQDNLAIQNGKKIGIADQGGGQFATANQTVTGVATSVELPVVVVKYPKGHGGYGGHGGYYNHK